MESFVSILFALVIFLFFFSAPVCWAKLIGSGRLFYPAVKLFRYLFAVDTKLIYTVPFCLLFVSWFVAVSNRAMDIVLATVTILYLFAPTSFTKSLGHRRAEDSARLSWVEFLVILMLWLPLEYGAWSGFLKNHFGKLAHVLPWGGATVLALFLFSGFRCLPGMKICLPTERKDFLIPFGAFWVAAVILIPLGLILGFIPGFAYSSAVTLRIIVRRFVAVWLGVALPEEILFRSLIQNWLTQKFGNSNMVLLIAAIIFGLSHLNNGPQALPNWRYAIIASVAGFIYGKVFQKTTSVCSSATLHAAVNTVKHFCFSGGKL